VKSLLKLLAAFLPWLVFLIVAQGSLFRVKLGLGMALTLSVIMGVLRLHRGIILWVGLVFLGAATISVVGFENSWTLRRLGVLANGALALGVWAGIAVGRPFTLDYAKAETDPSYWSSPEFIKNNFILSFGWAAAFTLNAVLAYLKMEKIGFSDLTFELTSYALLISTAVWNTLYSQRAKRLRDERERR
jgi:hypothetical protein